MKIYTDLHGRTSLFNIPDWGISEIQSIGADIIYDYDDSVNIYFGDLLVGEDVKSLPNLKWIHFPSVGINRALIPEVLNSDIVVTNSKGIFCKSVSSLAMSFILYFSKGLHFVQKLKDENKLNRENFDEYINYLKEPNDTKCLIVGYGDIGKELGKMCKSLNMKVYTIQTKDNLMESIYKNRPDFVINLLPLTLKTNHLFDAKLFKCMKPDSYFINLGRGKTVVEDDLIQILKDKVIAGAGLDVFDVEPLPKESELWNLDNVLMTPHIANIDKNYWKNQIELFIDNLQRFKNNKKLKNLMNLERGY